jgi:hypothetical protein
VADFLISYTSPDRAWAEWVAYVLEEAGFAVVVDTWDFPAGSNFVLEMQRAASESSQTIAIVSPDYLNSRFGAAEWAAAFAGDPEGLKRRLLPIRVRKCELTGIWKAIIYIDLVDLDHESALQRLLDRVHGKRAKPAQRPVFPSVISTDSKRHPRKRSTNTNITITLPVSSNAERVAAVVCVDKIAQLFGNVIHTCIAPPALSGLWYDDIAKRMLIGEFCVASINTEYARDEQLLLSKLRYLRALAINEYLNVGNPIPDSDLKISISEAFSL